MESVLESLRHRGPDEWGTWLSDDGHCLLAHTRLAIIGLGEIGRQPATFGRTGLAFNGEIYNYRSLGQGLPEHVAGSDTQVLLHRLVESGTDALADVRGMYALAEYDTEGHRLIASRDRWGIKPLYLLDHPSGGVTLSSELPALLLLSEAREIDPIGLAQYLCYGHTGPQLTMYRQIRKLLPGVVYEWEVLANRVVSLRTTRPPFALPKVTSLEDALTDSVRCHLESDVEVGVFLSSGVDSSLLASLARAHMSDLRSYTISFPDAAGLDESAMAAANAEKMRLRHTTVPVTARDMAEALDTVLRVHGEPLGDGAALPLTVLAARAAQDVKVVLTGEGADEMFGGYTRYRVSRFIPAHPPFVLRSLGDRLASPLHRYRTDSARGRALEAVLRFGGVFGHSALLGAELGAVKPSWAGNAVEQMALTDWFTASGGHGNPESSRRFDLTRWLPNTSLEKTDRATMASSLEARTPYLDSHVQSAVSASGRHFRRRDLEQLLHQRESGLQQPDRKDGLAVPLSDLCDTVLSADLAHALSPDGTIARTLGEATRRRLQQRSQRSRGLRYRLAVLGRWETR